MVSGLSLASAAGQRVPSDAESDERETNGPFVER